MKEFRSKRLRVWENISRTMQEFKVILLGYRSYTALLTQTGTDAPVATVLENTIGLNLNWVREYAGGYTLRFNEEIDTDKIFIPGYSVYDGSTGIITPLSNQGSINGYMQIYPGGSNISKDRIWMDFLDATFSAAEMSSIITNSKIYFEFRVYN